MGKPFAAIVCLGLCALAPTQGGKRGPKIEGTWTATSLALGEKKFPAERLEVLMYSFTFEEGKYTSSMLGKQDEAGSFKIDAKMKPAHIDLTVKEGKYKGKTHIGLIAVEGDVLKMALALAAEEKNRPKEFARGAGIFFATFKRSK
jgi:uncharacterized protein (TIGR03067 family)